MKALQIKNLTKIYDNNLVALDDISFEVEQGDFYALLGPNGAGKSTMIGIISSLVNKSSGKVNILGLDIDTHHSEAKKRIGIVGQEVNFNQFETVHNILLHQAGFFGMPFSEIKNNCEFYLKRLDLWDKRNEQGRNLSGGMKRRLMVAKALVNNPDLLILDEPTAGVDTELRRSLWEFLIEINKKGTTIILTTHYIEEAEAIADRVGVINQGEIIIVEEKNELLKKMGQKTLTVELQEEIKNIPVSLKKYRLEIGNNRMSLDYTYNLSEKQTGITNLLQDIRDSGLKLKDLKTEQSNLEKIFVTLVRENNEN